MSSTATSFDEDESRTQQSSLLLGEEDEETNYYYYDRSMMRMPSEPLNLFGILDSPPCGMLEDALIGQRFLDDGSFYGWSIHEGSLMGFRTLGGDEDEEEESSMMMRSRASSYNTSGGSSSAPSSDTASAMGRQKYRRQTRSQLSQQRQQLETHQEDSESVSRDDEVSVDATSIGLNSSKQVSITTEVIDFDKVGSRQSSRAKSSSSVSTRSSANSGAEKVQGRKGKPPLARRLPPRRPSIGSNSTPRSSATKSLGVRDSVAGIMERNSTQGKLKSIVRNKRILQEPAKDPAAQHDHGRHTQLTSTAGHPIETMLLPGGLGQSCTTRVIEENTAQSRSEQSIKPPVLSSDEASVGKKKSHKTAAEIEFVSPEEEEEETEANHATRASTTFRATTESPISFQESPPPRTFLGSRIPSGSPTQSSPTGIDEFPRAGLPQKEGIAETIIDIISCRNPRIPICRSPSKTVDDSASIPSVLIPAEDAASVGELTATTHEMRVNLAQYMNGLDGDGDDSNESLAASSRKEASRPSNNTNNKARKSIKTTQLVPPKFSDDASDAARAKQAANLGGRSARQKLQPRRCGGGGGSISDSSTCAEI